jgi:hypothetical protein
VNKALKLFIATRADAVLTRPAADAAQFNREKTMQTIKIDGTTYKLKFDRCPLEWTKAARKPYKPKKPKDIRKFPIRSDLSTAEYIRQFDKLNMLQPVDYIGASEDGTPQYDISIPLFEILPDEVY